MSNHTEVETAVLEIIELPDGEIALQRVDDSSSPLVKIRFSVESERMLAKMKMAVASAMIEAGMQAFAELNSIEEDEITVLH